MIHDKDRSWWFGASDTAVIMGSWKTKSFANWWAEKLGLRHGGFESRAMKTGTAYEHRILAAAGIHRMDRQIRKPRLRLRVNLDGETRKRIIEVKTYGGAIFKVTRAYWMQAQVQMYAAKKPVVILAYRLLPEDYDNWFCPIDAERMSEHKVEYDDAWIKDMYLPRLRYLARCLTKGAWPDENAYRHGDGANSRVRRSAA